MGWTSEQRTLVLTFFLFTSITIAQIIGALAANSLTLLGDAASMAVDSFSYLVNIYTEFRVDKTHSERNRLLSSGISLAFLFIVTMVLCVQALMRVVSKDNLIYADAGLIFTFGVFGLLFDIISLVYYYKTRSAKSMSIQLNMKSAMLHVVSDMLRSITTICCALIIWSSELNSGKVDAWSSFIVSLLIFVTSVPTTHKWLRSALAYHRGENKETTDILDFMADASSSSDGVDGVDGGCGEKGLEGVHVAIQ